MSTRTVISKTPKFKAPEIGKLLWVGMFKKLRGFVWKKFTLRQGAGSFTSHCLGGEPAFLQAEEQKK